MRIDDGPWGVKGIGMKTCDERMVNEPYMWKGFLENMQI
jgi:hypothetical protein